MGGTLDYVQGDNMAFVHHLYRTAGAAMTPERFASVTGRYPGLRIAVVGDYFLDRYLIIDPSKAETSIETGLAVHNVVEVRPSPGAAGTIVNNLVALGVGSIIPVGFAGDDGEGYELRRALSSLPGVTLEHVITSTDRRTPVYCKPLVTEPGRPPSNSAGSIRRTGRRLPTPCERNWRRASGICPSMSMPSSFSIKWTRTGRASSPRP